MEGGSSRRLVHERHHLLHDLQGVHGPGAVARLIVVPIAIFFLDIMSNLLATHRIALADEHGADAEVAQPHRPARGDEGEKRRGHRRLAGGRADQAQHPVAPRASGGQRWVWLTRSSGGRGVCLKQPPRPRERAEGLARSSAGERCLPSPTVFGAHGRSDCPPLRFRGKECCGGTIASPPPALQTSAVRVVYGLVWS